MQDKSHYLDALLALYIAISHNNDLTEVYDIVLDQGISQLHVDAAALVMYNPRNQQFKYQAGRGFRTQAIETTSLAMDTDHRRRLVLERQSIHVPNVKEETISGLSPLMESEGFIGYYGVPLIAGDQIFGALEVFHRAPLMLAAESIVFLQTLAAELAFAIERTRLFHQLQQSNLELIIAYDVTLQGWVRALDLRDRETEGHTQRVTELTLRLARHMGVSDDRLVHMARGALLHDIGKLGIPDAILFKPGVLTDEELRWMKQHPVLGYQLLLPIEFLQPSLDIVYCHHERWDGSGYPRGLKGEEIPLSARIFAVVDIWDALIADRPFRRAMPMKNALSYIKDQAGKTLDPQVVEAFLAVIHD